MRERKGERECDRERKRERERDRDRERQRKRERQREEERDHDLTEGPKLLDVHELLVHITQGELSMLELVDQLFVVLEIKLTAPWSCAREV